LAIELDRLSIVVFRHLALDLEASECCWKINNIHRLIDFSIEIIRQYFYTLGIEPATSGCKAKCFTAKQAVDFSLLSL